MFRIKNLLVAILLASMSFSVGAQDVHTQNGDKICGELASIKAGDKGVPIQLFLTRQNSADFTNIQCTFIFPTDINGKGIRPCANEKGKYVTLGEDVMDEGVPLLSISDNFNRTELYPRHKIVGVNIEKNSISVNPCHLYTIYVQCDEGMLPGDYTITANSLIYTSYNDDAYHTIESQDVVTIHVEGGTVEPDSTTFTDIDELDYALYVDTQNSIARKNKQCELLLNMKNVNPITLWQADLVLPTGYSIAQNSFGEPLIQLSGSRTNTNRHSLSYNTLSDGSLRIMCSSNSNYNFTGKDGLVASVTLNVPDNAVDGEYPIEFKNLLFVEDDETGHSIDKIVSKLVVKNYTLGDVNDDGNVNGIDLVALTNFILERPSAGSIFEAADVNQDGVINGSDYVRLVNAILGRIVLESAPVKKINSLNNTLGYEVYSNEISVTAGNSIDVPINIKNADIFTAWQADIELPAGFMVATAEVNNARTTAGKHNIAMNEISSGNTRLLCASATNRDFNGNDGEIATLKLMVDNDVMPGTYVVRIKNAMCIEANEKYHELQDYDVLLTVGAYSGINDLAIANDNVNVYNTQGQIVKRNVSSVDATTGLSQGIYIVGNKKVVVK